MKTLFIKVKGRVQGVFFRANVKDIADALGLKGWVRNEKDGSVSVLAQGSEQELREFVEKIKKSPGASKVGEVVVGKCEEKKEFKGFEIKRNGNYIEDKVKAARNLFR